MKNNFLIYLFYFILVLTWGSSFILMKYGLQFFTPPQVATIRQVSALVVLGGLAIFNVRKIPVKKLKYVVLSGLLSMFIPAYLFCYAESGLSSAIAGVLNALTPAFTVIISIMFYKQAVQRGQIIGMIIGFAGVLLLILFTASGSVSLNHFAFFAIAATVCYGININMVKVHLHDVNPIHTTTVAVASAGIVAIIYLFLSSGIPHLYINDANKIPLLASVTLGVFGTAIAQLLFYQLIKKASALFASTITYALPIVAIFWGVLDGEDLGIWHYAGMVLIIIGILIIRQPNFFEKKVKKVV
ncbi:DMT family transporter [Mucilaginibacter ginkgonis]|uniref:DMT family transporter n=1 Tax=Mucilaginibacter ginkgonis TaxID=2682091 RepID=A0A6I4HWE4_9SPHI|nr:DMT family transporter [Mucilaginibacter ginkgonis]QQL51158.1 DMT family transporter [Mucilaginibacter ginkgonis]